VGALKLDEAVNIFMSDHKGKCAVCGKNAPLDSMVSCLDKCGNVIKGKYQDIDCLLTKDISPTIDSYIKTLNVITGENKPQKSFKLFFWLFG